MTFANFVRARRTELGLSLGKLSMRTDITKTHLHDIEKGRAVNPKCSTVLALAAGLQCSAVEVFRVAAGLPSTPLRRLENFTAERPSLSDRIRAKRAEIYEALNCGDHKRAHQLDREERALWAQVGG